MDNFEEHFIKQTEEAAKDLLGTQSQIDALFAPTDDSDVMGMMEGLAEMIAIEDDDIKTIEAKVSVRKEQLRSAKQTMYDMLMANNCANGHKFDNGILIKPKVNVKVFKAAGIDDDTLFAWLEGHNLGDIIKRTVHWGTLSTTMKNEEELGRPLDTEVFTKSEEHTTAFAGNGKAKFLRARKGEE